MARKSKKGKKLTGGVVSNVDIELSDKDRQARDREDRNAAVIKDAVKEAESKQGGGVTNAGANLQTTYEQLADTKAFHADDRATLTPHYIADPDSRGVLLKAYPKAQLEALEEGRFCVRCDDLQATPRPPDYAGLDPKCNPHGGGRGCGFPRSREAWKFLPFVITELPEFGDAETDSKQ